MYTLCWVTFHNCPVTPQPHPPCWVKLNNEGNSLPLDIQNYDPGCRNLLKNRCLHRVDVSYGWRWKGRKSSKKEEGEKMKTRKVRLKSM